MDLEHPNQSPLRLPPRHSINNRKLSRVETKEYFSLLNSFRNEIGRNPTLQDTYPSFRDLKLLQNIVGTVNIIDEDPVSLCAYCKAKFPVTIDVLSEKVCL